MSRSTTWPRSPEPTGVALIIVDRSGENVIAVASGANAAVGATTVEPRSRRASRGPRRRPRQQRDRAPGRQAPPSRPVAAAARRRFSIPAPATGLGRRELGLVDILCPNRGELRQLVERDDRATGRAASQAARDPVDQARALLNSNSQGDGVGDAVIVTLGADGAVLVRLNAAPRWLAAPPVDPVDTVGAGDTFVGALAAALADGRSLEEATMRGVAAASLSTTRPGARGGMPTAKELEAALVEG